MSKKKEDVEKQPMPEDAERVPYYFPFMWRDWRDDRNVKKMSPSEKGIYLELMVEQWIMDGLNMEVDDLCHVTRARHDYVVAWLRKWGHKVLWCADCHQRITPEDVEDIISGNSAEVVQEQVKSSEEGGKEPAKSSQRGGKHPVKRGYNKKLRFLKFDVKYKQIPGTQSSEPIPIPILNQIEPILYSAPDGAAKSQAKKPNRINGEPCDCEACTTRCPGDWYPHCAVCGGRGTYAKDGKIECCDCDTTHAWVPPIQ